MGEHNVHEGDDSATRAFTQALLTDVQVLEQMLQAGMFEKGVRRMGAEQEMFLVDACMAPANLALEVLERAGEPRLTTELALFNLEANLSPRTLSGTCLREMHEELSELVDIARNAGRAVGAEVVLTGILPTLSLSNLKLSSMTPKTRYHTLNRALCHAAAGDFSVRISGIDELAVTHENILLESCNTSFQVHLQVDADDFARMYNMAQAITAPLLSSAVNSPLLLGKRLWHETRIALFEQSVDARSPVHRARGSASRVSFGQGWVKQSVLEIFREDIARFRVMIANDREEDSRRVLEEGGVPELFALRLHNGTVYRWNRPCYGVIDGVPHLRIENRVLPAGPSLADEMANAALFYGLMLGGHAEYGDIAAKLSFEEAKVNFVAAAREGLNAVLTWPSVGRKTAAELLTETLLPVARAGLALAGIDTGDAEHYLGLIAARIKKRRTGASWMLESSSALAFEKPDVRARALVLALLEEQKRGEPIGEWEVLTQEPQPPTKRPRPRMRTVRQAMSTELFTVRAQDSVGLAASMMDWKHIRHVPVEDDEGRLVGVLTYRTLLRWMVKGGAPHVKVSSIMEAEPVTIEPDAGLLAAMRRMQAHKISGLPVVENGKLVGLITEHDLMLVAEPVFERWLNSDDAFE